jgi:hypothetical protein
MNARYDVRCVVVARDVVSATAAAMKALFSAADREPHEVLNARPRGVYGTVPPGSHCARYVRTVVAAPLFPL